MSIHDFKVVNIDGEEVNLKDYAGKVVLIVNTASKCGFTPQYEGLEALYKKYNEKGLEILGFPCNQFAEQEPGANAEVKSFCMLNYGVSFPMFDKVEVRGENAAPLFKYLTENTKFEGFDMNLPGSKPLSDFINANLPHLMEGDSVKWNFTKFLINKEGNIVKRFEPPFEPAALEKYIEELL